MEPTDAIVVRGGIVVRPLRGDEVTSVVAALDAAEADAEGTPLVDESERQRLAAAEALGGDVDDRANGGWRPIGAFRGESPVGYAAVVAPSGVGGEPASARGDAAVLAADPTRAVLGALLAGVREVAGGLGVGELEVWVRRGGDREVDVATVERFEVARRLGVLGRHLDDPLPEPPEPAGHQIRAYRPDEDDAGVVEVLAAAYAGTPEAGWDLDGFRERRAYPWFRADDLLLAVDREDGTVGGLHWLKRRDERTGEVYNLAIHPRAQGRRLGPALLSAGLHHLADIGCDEVVLWVDRANERAVALYEGQGFTTRWDDLAFRAELR